VKSYDDYKNEYRAAINQSDYKPLLEDPNTPESIITSIIDSLTIKDLKIIALKHPNIIERSQRYILETSIKENYYKEIVEVFLSNKKDLSEDNWVKIRKWYNPKLKFDICVIELLDEQSDIFSKQKLDVILNALVINKDNIFGYMKGVMHHKNFDVKILEGKFIKDMYPTLIRILRNNPEQSNYHTIFSESPYKVEIFKKMFEVTSDVLWLPKEVQNIFIF